MSMVKNTLGDLNNHLFAQLEKLGDEDLKGDELEAEIRRSEAMAKVGEQITLDGVQYTVVGDKNAADTSKENADKNELNVKTITDKIHEGSHAVYKGVNYYAMQDRVDPKDATTVNDKANGVDDNNANVITAHKAYMMIQQELVLANNIGTDVKQADIDIAKMKTVDAAGAATAVNATGWGTVATDANQAAINNWGYSATTGKLSYIIEKGQVNVKEDLNFSLHVGADADMTNKIGVGIKALDTAGLGIKGLNVKDTTGAAATYAIDSIADAIATVSSQRSLLGAVQNRLEHTINNLDNVVENTTSAESQIRDTDMATEMVKYSNANILSQAGQSMLAQGNQSNQGVLSLLG